MPASCCVLFTRLPELAGRRLLWSLSDRADSRSDGQGLQPGFALHTFDAHLPWTCVEALPVAAAGTQTRAPTQASSGRCSSGPWRLCARGCRPCFDTPQSRFALASAALCDGSEASGGLPRSASGRCSVCTGQCCTQRLQIAVQRQVPALCQSAACIAKPALVERFQIPITGAAGDPGRAQHRRRAAGDAERGCGRRRCSPGAAGCVRGERRGAAAARGRRGGAAVRALQGCCGARAERCASGSGPSMPPSARAMLYDTGLEDVPSSIGSRRRLLASVTISPSTPPSPAG